MHNRERRGTTASPPGLSYPEARHNRENSGTHTVLARELTFSINPNVQQRFASLTKAIEETTGQDLYGPRQIAKVGAIAQRLSDAQAEAVVEGLHRHEGRLFIPRVIEVAEDLAAGPGVKRIGRRDPDPESVEMPEQIRMLADSLRA